ncbi:MAG: redoxin domain-containing protein [Cyclobacteriaceae bacterium]
MTVYRLFYFMLILSISASATLYGQGGICKITGTAGPKFQGSFKAEAIVFGKPTSFESAIQKGKFELSINQPAPTAYRVSISGKPEAGSLTLFCDHGDVKIQLAGDNFSDAEVTGSKSQTEWLDYDQGVQAIEGKLRAVQEYFEELAEKGEIGPKEDSLRFAFQSLSQGKENFIRSWILNHSDSYVAPFILAIQYGANPRVDVLKPLYTPLQPEVKSSYYGKVMGELVEKLDAVSIGKSAPSFTQADPEGKQVSLESFRGKYVLLDFWASWCGPCRQENPNLVKTYQRFRDHLTILGISLDQKREPWLKAIKDDQLIWQQVSDLKGWSNEVAGKYQVRSIPDNFLLDKEGRIIARGLRGADLDRALEKLLKP